jgi:hypothetical protein
MFAMTGGILDREPFLIHNLFPRGCLLSALDGARSQKHAGHVVIDEDGWLCTRVSVTQNVVNHSGARPQSQRRLPSVHLL